MFILLSVNNIELVVCTITMCSVQLIQFFFAFIRCKFFIYLFICWFNQAIALENCLLVQISRCFRYKIIVRNEIFECVFLVFIIALQFDSNVRFSVYIITYIVSIIIFNSKPHSFDNHMKISIEYYTRCSTVPLNVTFGLHGDFQFTFNKPNRIKLLRVIEIN